MVSLTPICPVCGFTRDPNGSHVCAKPVTGSRMLLRSPLSQDRPIQVARLVFVDCEAMGGSPVTGQLTEFGAVAFASRKTFHGILIETRPSAANPAIPELVPGGKTFDAERVFRDFDAWLRAEIRGHPIFISDNPAFDWQWINAGFLQYGIDNPFGFSARRIGDFYAGLVSNFDEHNHWKKLRVTPADHHPVHDALGNAEAFERLLAGER